MFYKKDVTCSISERAKTTACVLRHIKTCLRFSVRELLNKNTLVTRLACYEFKTNA